MGTCTDKKRAIHLLVECTNEEPVIEDGVKKNDTATHLLLQYKPELDVYDSGGSTPLTTAIALLKEDTVKLLVSRKTSPCLCISPLRGCVTVATSLLPPCNHILP